MNMEKLAQCLINHPTLDDRKKQILIINANSYFENIEREASVAQVARKLNCSEGLAQRYKDLFLQIDWYADSPANKLRINKLINVMSDIMDWQWDPANANRQRNPAERMRFFQPTYTQMTFIRGQQQERPQFNLLQQLIKKIPLILFALIIYWHFQQGNDHQPAKRLGTRWG